MFFLTHCSRLSQSQKERVQKNQRPPPIQSIPSPPRKTKVNLKISFVPTEQYQTLAQIKPDTWRVYVLSLYICSHKVLWYKTEHNSEG